ncbi:hypothetical protein B566_EDAN002736 [Ephemera danica]|nr:hypothetical protein B566_EDAN002736 [Ephemera danica]
MTEEDVIRRRLLIDGDGTGDDRRLNLLLKSFIKWSNTPEPCPDDDVQLDRMLAQLAQSELALKKSRLGANTSQSELDNYETLSMSIKQRLETAKTGIEESKEAFARAREVRKNRMEYNAMAGVILQQPDRKEMLEKLEQIKTELAELENKRHELDEKLELRRKRLHLLNVAITDFTEDTSMDLHVSAPTGDTDISLEPFDMEDEEEQAMNQE